MQKRFIPVLAALAALAACASAPSGTPAAAAPAADSACPIVETSGWKAWVNRMPGPGASPTLIVEGQVSLPSTGYAIALIPGRADRSATPVQQLLLEITPPAGQAAQMVTPQTARIDTPAIAAKYKAVQIVCAGKVITEISDVPDAY